MHPSDYGKVTLWGKTSDTPRYVQSYGSDYTYTGMNHQGIAIPPSLFQLKEWLENRYGSFQQVLLNWYENGHKYIGSHADNEPQIKKRSPIVSITLGATRKFRIRKNKTKEIVYDLDIPDRTIVVMCGKFQEELKHEIVKVNGEKGEQVGPRINITMRQFN